MNFRLLFHLVLNKSQRLMKWAVCWVAGQRQQRSGGARHTTQKQNTNTFLSFFSALATGNRKSQKRLEDIPHIIQSSLIHLNIGPGTLSRLMSRWSVYSKKWRLFYSSANKATDTKTNRSDTRLKNSSGRRNAFFVC